MLISNGIIQKKEREYYENSWQYVADTNFELKTETNKDGTIETFYAISTPEQLAGMFETSNSNTVSAESINTYSYRLTKNIDLSGKNWIVNDFSKEFNGNSFHIKNLNIESISSNYLGFVKELSGTIKNLYFDSIYISSLSTSSGIKYIGGVASYLNGGKIENVYVNSGTIYGAKFNESYSSRLSYTGGIVGYVSSGNIKQCINNAAVSYGYYIGGIAGQTNGTIEQCINKGTINYADSYGYDSYVGGITGTNSGTIRLCQNMGYLSISAYSITIKYTAYMGGIAGNSSGTISECSNSGQISQGGRGYSMSNIYAGGIAGSSWGGEFSNCLNTASVSANADIKTSTSAYNVSTQKVDETQYHDHSFFFWGWASDWLWYTRKEASISIVEMNAYAGGIVGYGSPTISNCYNSGSISGGFKTVSVSIEEVLKKDSKYLSFAGGNPVTKTQTSTFSVYTAIRSGAINGSDAKSQNSGSSVSNSLSLKDKCSFYTGSYSSTTGFHYQYFGAGYIINATIGGSSKETDSGEFTAMQIGIKDCNGNSQSAGRVVHKVTRNDNSYTVYTYPERMYESDKEWINDFSGSKTMLKITDVDTTFVKDANVSFIDSFSSSNLSTLGRNYWEIENGEPKLKNLYW